MHEPAPQSGKDPAFSYKRRLGVFLFLCYAAIYAAFIAINVIDAKLMDRVVFSGLNLAVIYGFGLILLALVLALLYSAMCSRREKSLAAGKEA